MSYLITNWHNVCAWWFVFTTATSHPIPSPILSFFPVSLRDPPTYPDIALNISFTYKLISYLVFLLPRTKLF